MCAQVVKGQLGLETPWTLFPAEKMSFAYLLIRSFIIHSSIEELPAELLQVQSPPAPEDIQRTQMGLLLSINLHLIGHKDREPFSKSFISSIIQLSHKS